MVGGEANVPFLSWFFFKRQFFFRVSLIADYGGTKQVFGLWGDTSLLGGGRGVQAIPLQFCLVNWSGHFSNEFFTDTLGRYNSAEKVKPAISDWEGLGVSLQSLLNLGVQLGLSTQLLEPPQFTEPEGVSVSLSLHAINGLYFPQKPPEQHLFFFLGAGYSYAPTVKL